MKPRLRGPLAQTPTSRRRRDLNVTTTAGVVVTVARSGSVPGGVRRRPCPPAWTMLALNRPVRDTGGPHRSRHVVSMRRLTRPGCPAGLRWLIILRRLIVPRPLTGARRSAGLPRLTCLRLRTGLTGLAGPGWLAGLRWLTRSGCPAGPRWMTGLRWLTRSGCPAGPRWMTGLRWLTRSGPAGPRWMTMLRPPTGPRRSAGPRWTTCLRYMTGLRGQAGLTSPAGPGLPIRAAARLRRPIAALPARVSAAGSVPRTRTAPHARRRRLALVRLVPGRFLAPGTPPPRNPLPRSRLAGHGPAEGGGLLAGDPVRDGLPNATRPARMSPAQRLAPAMFRARKLSRHSSSSLPRRFGGQAPEDLDGGLPGG